MNPLIINSITSNQEETFNLQVFGYNQAEDLEDFFDKNTIQSQRIIYDGKPKFISEALAKEIVPNDGSHILKKLQPPKQSASYMIDLEDPKPVYKDFKIDKFCLSTAKKSIESLQELMGNPAFLLFYLNRKD